MITEIIYKSSLVCIMVFVDASQLIVLGKKLEAFSIYLHSFQAKNMP